MNLGKCIEIALQEQDMTATQLADKMGVSKQRISVLVNSRNAHMRTVDRVAKALGMTGLELLTLELETD